MKWIVSTILIMTLTACQEDKKPIEKPIKPVKSMVINSQVKKQQRVFVGTVEATIKAELSFEVSGKLNQLLVLDGDTVKEKQLLASIDTKRYQDQVEQAKAKYNLDLAQFQRAEKLIQKDFISKSEHDILKSKMNISKANLETAQKNLKDTSLYAPFNGVVAKVDVENHEYINAKEPIMRVHDLSAIDIEIQVPEYIIKQLQASEKVHSKKTNYQALAIFDNFSNLKFPLTLKEYTSKADEKIQTFRVVYSMPSPKQINVLPGMSVNVQILMPDYKNAKKPFYLIPSSSVFSGLDKKPQVWLINPETKKIKAVTIKTTSLNGNNIKVISGLNSGDQIVTAGVNFLREGQIVKPIAKDISIKDNE